MKKILIYSIAAIFFFSVSSCEKGLSDLNQNRTSPITLDPVLMLNTAVLNSSFSGKTLFFDIAIVQQIVTPNGGVLAGGNFNADYRGDQGLWGSYYTSVIKNTKDAILKAKDIPSRSNLYNMGRIFQAFAFMVLTDEYGDIPYSEGNAGYTDQLFFPKYDAQSTIYPKIIQELSDASAALNATGLIESADVLYSGNIVKWKKFANSLLLRAGMRLSKVDAAKAKSTVQAAFAAGVITDNTDNAYIRHDANYGHPLGGTLNGSEAANFYLTKPFIDRLKSTNDPRLSAIAIRYIGATSGNGQTVTSGNTTAPIQIGMPMGKDNGTIVPQATADGLASFYDYSQADRRRILKVTAPLFIVTASQSQLLLAEAAFRGWITTGTAAQYFSDGIKAHMDQMAVYDAACTISTLARDTYVSANPLNAGTELDQINSQYWISSFLNGPELFANFRRSGFPNLTPNPYGQPANPDVPNGTFIRRITYPTSEVSVNATNLNAAIALQGADKLSTRIWWDKP